MLVVNTNISSLRAQRELTRTRFNLSVAMQRISSGVRLNSSKDDAVGIGISERITTQIKGLSMAIKNANDGIGFLQTAEGSLQEVTNLTQQMREMAVQAVDGANNAADLASLQVRVRELSAEVTRIASQTEINGKTLLDGEVINAEFQVGIRAEQTIQVSIPAVSSANIGSFSTTSNNNGELSGAALGKPVLGSLGEAPPNPVVPQILTLRGFSSDVTASQINVELGESARSIAAKVNAEQDRSGITATAKTTVTLEGVYDIGIGGTQTMVFRLYGENVKVEGVDPLSSESNAVFITANIQGDTQEGLNPLISAINTHTITTGITAAFVAGTDGAGGKIELVQERGENISLEGFKNVSPNELPGAFSTMLVHGMPGTDDPTLVGNTLTEDGEDSVTVGGTITLHSYKPFTVTSDAAQGDSLFLNGFDGLPQGAEFSTLADIDFSRPGGASEALRVITDALDFISSMRADIGTIQNRFESTIANLGSVLENAEAARSRIYDADFGEETARLTKAQILQEAGIAILAQANTIPQAVLALLRA